jgi:hypothetical protein
MFNALYDNLAKQAEGKPVEILALLDNKMRTIGMKRQALLDIAQGEYLAFVDDDDGVDEHYVAELINAIKQNDGVDLIVFPIKVTLDGKEEGLVEPSISYIPKDDAPLCEYKSGVAVLRPPHELSCFRTKIARTGSLPDT